MKNKYNVQKRGGPRQRQLWQPSQLWGNLPIKDALHTKIDKPVNCNHNYEKLEEKVTNKYSMKVELKLLVQDKVDTLINYVKQIHKVIPIVLISTK